MFAEFQDKTFLITGSSRGIGKATAQLLSEYGARTILNCAKSEEELRQAEREIPNSFGYLCDVTDETKVAGMIQDLIQKYGQIDGLVNNAGLGGWSDTLSGTKDSWHQTFDVDLFAAINVSKHLIPHFQKQKTGVIVNVASISGLAGNNQYDGTDYSVMKAGLIKYTQLLASQLAPNIRVNAIAPGYVKTSVFDFATPEDLARISQDIALKRFATPEEIAPMIVFLLSQMASYMTGETVTVDGGYMLFGRRYFV
jgi:3-oxoacyl-[acyl-carrier protein] reductase